MKSFHFKFVFVSAAALLASVNFSACGKHLVPDAAAPMTPTEAEENMAARLEQSARVRKQAHELRDAFRKAQGVLQDFGWLTDRLMDRAPGKELVQLVDQIPEIFGAFSKSSVQTEVDGTWRVEVPILVALKPGDIAQCLKPRARLTGKRILDQEDLVLYVSDCEGANWDRLAKWIVRPDGDIEMSYWPEVRANLRPIAGQADPTLGRNRSGECSFRLHPETKRISVSCTQKGTNGPFTFESLDIQDVPEGTAATLIVQLENRALVSAQLLPHQSPRLTYCPSEGGKCISL